MGWVRAAPADFGRGVLDSFSTGGENGRGGGTVFEPLRRFQRLGSRPHPKLDARPSPRWRGLNIAHVPYGLTGKEPPRSIQPGDVVAHFSEELGEWTAAQLTDLNDSWKTVGV